MISKLVSFFKPNFGKIVILFIFFLLIIFVLSDIRFTSKVTVYGELGVPQTFLILRTHRFFRRRIPFCRYVRIGILCFMWEIEKFYFSSLLVDIFFWYIVSCLIYFVVKWGISRRKVPVKE